MLAASGSAVGLGNIWRFPYVAGENGGGAFVFAYLLSVLLLGVPIMIAEILLGRRGGRNPVGAMRVLALQSGSSWAWSLVGWMGLCAGLLILSFYSVVAGWILHYLFLDVGGGLRGLDKAGASAVWSSLLASPWLLLGWHSLFLLLSGVVIALGVKRGLERMVKVLMPALFLLLVLLVGYALRTSGFSEAMAYLFAPDFSALGPSVMLKAMGQAFFSLSIGLGAIMAYGAYLPRGVSLPVSAGWIVALDTLVALLAGIAIFPLVFTYGLEADGGPGLIFHVLPLVFGQMPLGGVFGLLFFGLLFIAAWTSAVSLLEPSVAFLVENTRLRRGLATLAVGLVPWVLGIGCLLSLNLWQTKFFDKSFFDLLDYLTANVMLPLGGLFIAVFAGWFLHRSAVTQELEGSALWVRQSWLFLVRFVAPLGVLLLFLSGLGVFGA